MSPNAETIFNEARAMPAAERAGYLKGACGNDADLRAEVESLLEADAEAASFMAGRDTGTRTAEQRRTDLSKLSSTLRGDLDWIVMKCLEKDRTRRYETANGLAADIRRHLDDEPVVAGSPSTSYRLKKFMRRNRAGVLAGAAIAAVLVLGLAGTTYGLLEAKAQAELAAERADEANAPLRLLIGCLARRRCFV
jgi:hypothetical protein